MSNSNFGFHINGLHLFKDAVGHSTVVKGMNSEGLEIEVLKLDVLSSYPNSAIYYWGSLLGFLDESVYLCG